MTSNLMSVVLMSCTPIISRDQITEQM